MATHTDISTLPTSETSPPARKLPMQVLGPLRAALVITITLVLLTGGLFPLITTGLARVLFPKQVGGGLIIQGDTVVGAELIGQDFTSPQYFHPRPSATQVTGGTDAAPYNAAQSSASNLGPKNPDLAKAIADRAATYRTENGLAADATVPVDAVTASGSGLDPDIAPANAALQVGRVAQARGLSPAQVQSLVAKNTEGRQFGILGEPRVNVLKLNLALDAQFGKS